MSSGFDSHSDHWTGIIVPRHRPTRLPLGAGFLPSRILEAAAVITLILDANIIVHAVAAAAALFSIGVSASRWRTNLCDSVADLHRWSALRKILFGDVMTAVGDQAGRLDPDELAHFIAGANAWQLHCQRIAVAENTQACSEIGIL